MMPGESWYFLKHCGDNFDAPRPQATWTPEIAGQGGAGARLLPEIHESFQHSQRWQEHPGEVERFPGQREKTQPFRPHAFALN